MNTPRKIEHQQTDRGYVPVYATGVVEQPWASYSRSEHAVWDTLFQRQLFIKFKDEEGLDYGGVAK